MPRLKIAHVSDGATVASFVARKLTGNISQKTDVDLLHLKPVTPSTSSASSRNDDDSELVTISILLVTPSLMVFLNELKEHERLSLIDTMKCQEEPVSLSCFVPVPEAIVQITEKFKGADYQWRHLDIGPTRKSFQQCVIELLSMMEEFTGDMPLPTLKMFHLLPDKSVLPGDTLYILLDKHLIGENVVQSLNIVFDDDSQVTANQIADCLYQFYVPESLESSRRMEVFTSDGQPFGEDVIQYKDKLQVFADVLCDLLNPIETLCRSAETEEIAKEKMDPVISDWFKFGIKGPISDDATTMFSQWVKHLQSGQISPESVSKDLPLFLYLCSKHNLHMFAQTVMGHLKASGKGKTQRQGRSSQGSSSQGSSSSSESDKDAAAQLSAQKEDNEDTSYESVSELFTPGYCTPDDIFVQPRSGKQLIYVDIPYENVTPRKISSAIIPGMVRPRSEKEKLCKSCPPVCSTHGPAKENCSDPCYSNICPQPQEEGSKCSLGESKSSLNGSKCSLSGSKSSLSGSKSSLSGSKCSLSGSKSSLAANPDPQCSDESHPKPYWRSNSIPETAIVGSSETDPLPGDEKHSSTANGHKIPLRIPVETPPSIKNDNSARPPYPERPSTPILPKQNMMLSLVTDINIQDESDDDIKPRLPPRPNSDSSKPALSKPKRSRRLSLASPVSPSAPSTTHITANNLTFPRPPKVNIPALTKPESYTPPIPPRSSETVLGSYRNKAPPIPYSCRPSPPIPKNAAPKIEHSQSMKRNNLIATQRSWSTSKLNTVSESRPLRSSVSESSQNSHNYQEDPDAGQTSLDSPDYSHPLNLYLQGFKKAEEQSEVDEVIYDIVDEFFQNSIVPEEEVIYDVPRKFTNIKDSEARPASFEQQQSPSPPLPASPQSPIPPANKKSSKTSPLWSSLSSKLSLRKPGKTKKHVTKL